ncbi:hypothetical protein ZHAS_00009083 [Anopheles sinensis]|uniref:Secreted protein n=1 Tax=Anopheles sinensis TaxID=74873 RepID=A0A084VU45_ANOSI|nr:hypothetical protein ZHAS_00009083 [Anopheles sinensis]
MCISALMLTISLVFLFTEKRISPNLTSASSPLVPEQLKASPPTKRNLLLKRNGTATGALPVKTPLKEKNIRLF